MVWEMGARFWDVVVNDRISVTTLSLAGGDVTFRVTATDCAEPEQLPVEQVTFNVVE